MGKNKTKKCLIWLEPYEGWSFGDNEKLMDTGLCNRLLHWEIAQFINMKNNYQFSIIVEKDWWPELEIMDLPNTEPIKNIDLSESTPITESMLIEMFENKNFSFESDSLYADFGYIPLSEIRNKIKKTSRPSLNFFNYHPSVHFKFKDDAILNTIHNFTCESIGIHIRRGNGVTISEKKLNSIPEKFQEQYRNIEEIKTVKEPVYSFIHDEEYFFVMDEILKINPQKKFYISSDINSSLLGDFYKRYHNNLVDKDYLYSLIKNYLILDYDADFVKKNEPHIITLIDLFSLSLSEFMIGLYFSSWFYYSLHYKIKEMKDVRVLHDEINDGIENNWDE